MSVDISKIVSDLGDDMIAKAGEPVGLNREQSVRAAHALAARCGLGGQAMIEAAATDTGLGQEVVSALSRKLVEAGGEKLMNDTGVKAAAENAKDQAMAALSNAGGDAARNAGGMLGRLFGRK
ncbi:MAG: hypothetical protein AB7L65_08415 [Hyphomonadaceae bacterium]